MNEEENVRSSRDHEPTPLGLNQLLRIPGYQIHPENQNQKNNHPRDLKQKLRYKYYLTRLHLSLLQVLVRDQTLDRARERVSDLSDTLEDLERLVDLLRAVVDDLRDEGRILKKTDQDLRVARNQCRVVTVVLEQNLEDLDELELVDFLLDSVDRHHEQKNHHQE